MNTSIEIIILSIVTTSITAIVIYTTIKNMHEIKECKKFQKQKRLEFEIKYISSLESIADSNMIYNYFREIRKKLPESLHNIMLGKALINDFHARLYLNQIDLDGKCKLPPFRKRMLK